MIRLESNHFDDFCSRIFLSILSGWFSFSCGGPYSSTFLEGAKWSELVQHMMFSSNCRQAWQEFDDDGRILERNN